ncbi:hypothetical protein GCM10010339_93510 [Streptomyces alanosinicus]|uniref:Secreted protein n=1 Tax=Streptomyces alanosinicus TaxID=68171 RepID=A0A918MGN5_9ACTN|nr:hypothetical protein GCM10010339_93510 [Streptomyces alanosinicus]
MSRALAVSALLGLVFATGSSTAAYAAAAPALPHITAVATTVQSSPTILVHHGGGDEDDGVGNIGDCFGGGCA